MEGYMSPENLRRRALVASAATLPALAVPPLASTEPDPIFAAIERIVKPWRRTVLLSIACRSIQTPITK
jgi:hypothetical protein